MVGPVSELSVAQPSAELDAPFDLKVNDRAQSTDLSPAERSSANVIDDELRRMHHALAERDNDAAGDAMVAILGILDALPCDGLEQAERQLIGRAMLAVVAAFVQPTFAVPERLAFALLRFNVLISNVFAGHLGSTTDPFLRVVSSQPQWLLKTLVLYSARNEVVLDVSEVLVTNPTLVSQWFFQTWFIVHSGNCSPVVNRNLTRFLSQADHRLLPAPDMQEMYWGCSYLGSDEERRAKALVNAAIQRHLPIEFRHGPQSGRIAVLSDNWFPGHSVHRTLNAFVQALKHSGRYHLTLVHSLRPADELDIASFDEVVQVPVEDGYLDTGVLESKGFAVALFTDVGMNLPSIILANQRLAPVQIAMVGHSVSTFGGVMDYFVSGQDVEQQVLAEHNYSERPVLLPGYGVIHDRPTYQPSGRVMTTPEMIVNAAWSGPKISPRVLAAVSAIAAQSMRPMRLRIFSSTAPLRMKGMAAFVGDIERAVGRCRVEIVPYLAYEAYMAMMEEADFALDMFPFGGCNTVSDNFYLRKPVVLREGGRWFNRIGPAMARSIGLDELVATSDEEYVQRAVRLANDDAYRHGMQQRLATADLDTTIYGRKGVREFLEFVSTVMENPAAYPGRDPILLSVATNQIDPTTPSGGPSTSSTACFTPGRW